MNTLKPTTNSTDAKVIEYANLYCNGDIEQAVRFILAAGLKSVYKPSKSNPNANYFRG